MSCLSSLGVLILILRATEELSRPFVMLPFHHTSSNKFIWRTFDFYFANTSKADPINVSLAAGNLTDRLIFQNLTRNVGVDSVLIRFEMPVGYFAIKSVDDRRIYRWNRQTVNDSNTITSGNAFRRCRRSLGIKMTTLRGR